MVITDAQYNEYNGEVVSINATLDGVTRTIPISEDNTDYQEIMRQVAAGELTIADAE